jgi:hypothetical protein
LTAEGAGRTERFPTWTKATVEEQWSLAGDGVRGRGGGECERLTDRGPSAVARGRPQTKQEEGLCPSLCSGPDAATLILSYLLGPAFGHLENGFSGQVKLSAPVNFWPWKGIYAQDVHRDFINIAN